MTRSALFRMAVLLSMLAAALSWSPVRAQGERVRVVATFSVLGDIVANVGGDRIELRTLVGPDGDPHTFDPTPADGRALANARLVFEIGLGFEPWLGDLHRAARSGARRVAVTDGLALLRSPEEGHRHGAYDPHVWHDVTAAIHMTYLIRDALIATDPDGHDTYSLNAAVYARYLDDLDSWVFGRLSTVPDSRRKLVTTHNSFAYFAHRYGFEVVGAAIPSVSTDAQPSARATAALVERIRAAGVPAIFPENITNVRLIARIAAEAGVTVAPPLYTDALGRPGSPGDTYYTMIQYNVNVIASALSR